MTNAYTWDVYSPFGVGLESIFNRLDAMSGHNTNYPPYNIIKNDSSNYEIEVALAGFKPEDTERTYLHKGLSKRSFNHSWQLSEDVRVSSVDFADGLLTISLEKIIPEHQKRTMYKIGSGSKQLLTEG
jgi:molecular chaperone IbpA